MENKLTKQGINRRMRQILRERNTITREIKRLKASRRQLDREEHELQLQFAMLLGHNLWLARIGEDGTVLVELVDRSDIQDCRYLLWDDGSCWYSRHLLPYDGPVDGYKPGMTNCDVLFKTLDGARSLDLSHVWRHEEFLEWCNRPTECVYLKIVCGCNTVNQGNPDSPTPEGEGKKP